MFERLHSTDRYIEVRHALRHDRRYRPGGHRVLGVVYDHYVVLLADGWDSRTDLFMTDATGEISNWFPVLSAPTYHEATSRLASTTEEQWDAVVAARPPASISPVVAVVSATSVFRGAASEGPPPRLVAGAGLVRHALLKAGLPSGDRLEGTLSADKLASAMREARRAKTKLPLPDALWDEVGWSQTTVDGIMVRLEEVAHEALAAGYADVAWTTAP